MTDRDEIWLERPGVRLYATTTGTDTQRAVILVHGGLATHAACRLFSGPLETSFRVITPDLRGAGKSVYRDNLSWDALADDVAALAASLGVLRAVVGGVSFGAGCAVNVALRHAALVEHLVLLHPAYGGAELGLCEAQRAAMAAMDEAGRRAPAEGMSVLFPLLARLPAEVQARARTVMASYDPGSVAATTRFMASGAQPFERGEQLQALAMPVLVVPGIDPQHPAAVADVFAKHVSTCVVRAVEPAGFGAAIAAFADDRY